MSDELSECVKDLMTADRRIAELEARLETTRVQLDGAAINTIKLVEYGTLLHALPQVKGEIYVQEICRDLSWSVLTRPASSYSAGGFGSSEEAEAYAALLKARQGLG